MANVLDREAIPLEIEIHKSPTENDISGFLLRHPRSIIGVNSLHHPNRQRFTIAHEIAHFLLHDQDRVYVDLSVVRFRPHVRLRSGVWSTGEVPAEVEANQFAAELLMPRDLIAHDFEEFAMNDFMDERRMLRFAKHYQVSVQAMVNQPTNLGYLSPDELGVGARVR